MLPLMHPTAQLNGILSLTVRSDCWRKHPTARLNVMLFADCEESRLFAASIRSIKGDAYADYENSLSSEASSHPTKPHTFAEESLFSRLSNQKTGVRVLLGRKWRRLKALFC